MKNVIIYSTPTCVYCNAAKQFFKDKNVDYKEHDLTKNPEIIPELSQRMGSPVQGVPIIEIDGQFFVGFNREKITAVLGV